ncbi:hypothetical protein FOCG_14184 [Fusarium oxysporum f. sp. radicis-lycopersici 26381]|nr:uncharacterized protein FOBCDRAFT_1386 [Fusarium oxysporum Fo47]EWZ87087.1 hypothetical protein FOWG_10498 [Fusarium oxysporum f. sp. lycopersici MN25]EXL43915.1 hypothetical protein FOCG_14184 [Fusarium oxysporum f. sp. radicis-lycopersici 26381]KAJ4126185.1 hypothetical protein NW765_001966 [Fusarium oxysporum]RKK29636.1 hypothetical protein BFJ65_g1552 [Fusarium oxysporum f. sp. cepae]RYC93046.1 hypothetical protein BFJ63_vAg4183 [Fusarium oxysporum f. sp. narcissi]
MTTVASEARPRPSIEPIRTSGPGVNVRSLRSRIIQKSPSWTPSPLSPHTRPLPQLREREDDDMKQDDDTKADQLEPRKRDLPKLESGLRNVSLRPIAPLSLPSPGPSTLPSRRSPLSAPLLAPPVFQRPTLADETRSMLLQESDAERGGESPHVDCERRQSAPGGPLHARAMHLARQREHHRRRWIAASYRPREPEIFVLPVELCRLSQLSSSDAEASLPYPSERRLTTRVAVHSPGRKSIILTRTFDLDELRATLPVMSPLERHKENRRASVVTLQPPSVSSRASSPGISHERRHSHGVLPRVDAKHSPAYERRGSRQGCGPVAIRLSYARTYLPVLAAVILSEHVRPGATVELPLPHPHAWGDTVAHVYTGRVTLTEPIKQNILYLGGSV